jgi:hypothetical protein
MTESYVVCEGFHDRAFWSGLLLRLGCSDPGYRPHGRRVSIRDPFGDTVSGGHYAFLSRSGKFIRIVAAGGKDNIPDVVRLRLTTRSGKPLERLVVNVDLDMRADGTPTKGKPLTFAILRTVVGEFDNNITSGQDGDMQIDQGRTVISFVPWQTPDLCQAGIPHQHCLERVICAALSAAYPHRPDTVESWLQSRQDAPEAGPKEYAWSYLAGWHAATASYEGFCSALWRDVTVSPHLEDRLKASGVWRVAQLLAA